MRPQDSQAVNHNSRVCSGRPIPKALRVKHLHVTHHSLPRSTRAVFLDVCARAAEPGAAAVSQLPAQAPSVDIDDDKTISEFIASVRKCSSVKELKKLVRFVPTKLHVATISASHCRAINGPVTL